MRILLTGANGYIGKRLLPVLVEQGHEVYAVVRNAATLNLADKVAKKVVVKEADFLRKESLTELPREVDFAFFLIHALDSGSHGLEDRERQIAENFVQYLDQTTCRQQIYLGGISNDDTLSPHLSSRLKTEALLAKSKVPLTVLRAAIIIGSGGASFEIIRDLVEKLPIMIAPKWLQTKCQPIGIRNVIQYLYGVMGNQEAYQQTYDIGGPEILTYKQMLLQFAAVRKMKRWIITVPVMTPRLSSYWLYFVTSTSYRLAVTLVDSMKNEVIVKKGNIQEVVPQELLSYQTAVQLAFKRIEQNMVVSSWIDTIQDDGFDAQLNDFIEVPQSGTFTDRKVVPFHSNKKEQVLSNIWSIGGNRGWYYGNWMWRIRGYIDKLFGGVGLRRGRRSPIDLSAGDSLDFWRVLLADQQKSRLLLYAEMKLPGEAWLEFKIRPKQNNSEELQMVQTATFRPKGLGGRWYWHAMLPFHLFIFKHMAKNIVNYAVEK